MKMRIVYIHQYFKTPREGGAIRSYYIARALVEAGCEVEMITGHNSRHYVKKVIDGISVHYLPVSYDNSFGFYKRIIAFLRFIVPAVRCAAEVKADLCYATSTPLSVGLVALWLKRKYKIPYYFEVRDLWPEAPIALGFLKNPVLIALARWVEKKIYHSAEKIVCLSPGIENAIKMRFLYLPTLRVPNMSDCRYFHPEAKRDLALKKYNIDRKEFVISYYGALGKVNHVEYLLDAAGVCQQRTLPVRFIISGKGAMEKALHGYSKKLGLRNVIFTGHLSRDEIQELLNITDAAYISFVQHKILEINSPNKFFDALAAGKFVITNTAGWTKELIDEHACGMYVNPEHPEELANKVTGYLSDPLMLEEHQKNARKLAESRFSREELTGLLIREIVPDTSQQKKDRAISDPFQ